MRREEDIVAVNELCPEYIGFVFASFSKRYVTLEQAKSLSKRLDQKIIPVGVFVNEEISYIQRLVEEEIIRCVQLHGDETKEYISELRNRVSVPIIQAFRIHGEEDIEKANQSSADYVLLDSGYGSGTRFDASFLPKIQREYFLAGGLTIDNVEEIVREYHPMAVDVSSAIESDRYKDKEKMKAFMSAVRKAER